MPTAIISDTTWAGISPSLREARLRVRPYCLPRTGATFVAVELALLAAALVQAYYGGRNLGAFVLVACCVFFYHVNNLDRSVAASGLRELVIDIAESISTGLAVTALVVYWFPFLMPRLGVALAATILVGLAPLALRPVFHYLIGHKKLVDGILIAGTGELAGKLYRALANRNGGGSEPRGGTVVTFAESLAERGAIVGVSEFNEILSREHISRVIVAEQDPQSKAILDDALLAPRLRGLQVDDAADFYERLTGKIWVEAITPQWLVYTDGFSHTPVSARVERIVDVALATLMILLTAPLLALIAIAVKVDSPGPVLFRQTRAGMNGEPFTIYKFRTMRTEAERDTGPVWATEKDDRATSVGKYLRKYRLDEIPQAFNVLRGEMSIVGPRPERPCFVEQLSQQIPFYNFRHYVRPGITGWAQVMYRYGASIEDAYEKLQYDLYYAKHKSLACNGWILLKTLKIVLFGRGR